MTDDIAYTALGIDPGYDRMGWAVGLVSDREVRLLECGCIETSKNASLTERYQELCAALDKLIALHCPKEAAIETLYFSKNTSTAMKVSEARGIIIGKLLQNNVAVFDYHPNEIKLAVTGYGKADKQAVEKMVHLQTKLENSDQLDDAIDAVACLITHAAQQN